MVDLPDPLQDLEAAGLEGPIEVGGRVFERAATFSDVANGAAAARAPRSTPVRRVRGRFPRKVSGTTHTR